LTFSGTGASCIYPLLGVSLNNWNFLATDINETSLQYAKQNVKLNHWEDKIELRHVEEGKLLKGVVEPEERYFFCYYFIL
jgi:23S rRNA A1618 N6-methylase RlmF